MMRAILLVSLAILFVSTAAQESFTEDNFEEDNFEQEQNDDIANEHERNLAFAQKSLQQNKPSACRDLANGLKEEVDTGVKSDQKALYLITDQHCAKEGTDLVKGAETSLQKKTTEHKHAVTELTESSNAKVKFGTRTFSSLTEGNCDSFFTSTSYTTAETRHTSAKHQVTKVTGEVEEAKIFLTKAKAEAARLQHACRCRVKKLQLETFERFSKNNAARKEAYGKASMLLCVLDGKDTADKSCTAYDVPTLKMPNGVHRDKCVTYIAKGVTQACPNMCGQSKVTLEGTVACVGIRGATEPMSKCDGAKLVKPAVEKKDCPSTQDCGSWKVTRRDTATDCPKVADPCKTQPKKRLHGEVRCVCSAGICNDKHCGSVGKPATPFVDCPTLGKGSKPCQKQEQKVELAQKAVKEKAEKTQEIANKKTEAKKKEQAEKADLKEKADKSEKKDKHVREVAEKKEKSTKAQEAAEKKKEKDTKERNTKAEQKTKADEKKKKAAEAASERKTKAAEQTQKKNEAIVAAQVAAAAAVKESNELRSKACGVRTWRTNRWYAWTDCCQGCDGRSPSPGGLRGTCIARQKYGWTNDSSECTCRAQPKGVRDFKTNRYYFNTDCCDGCRAAQSQCIQKHPGAAWTSVCTCRMSC